MRLERLGLSTWLLAGLLVWALAAWGALLAGAAGSLPAGPAQATQAPPVPALVAAPRSTVLPLADYRQLVERPLFAADRKPHPFFLDGGQRQDEQIRLSGVLMVPGFHMATLTLADGKSLRLREGGEAVEGWQLLSLQPRSATLVGPAGKRVLELSVSGAGQADANGDGAQSVSPDEAAPSAAAAPTATAAPAPATVSASADQLRAIRERIQARRKAQQAQQGAQHPSPHPNP